MLQNGRNQRFAGQGAGGNNRFAPFRRRQGNNFFLNKRYQRVGSQFGSHHGGKSIAVNRQRSAGRNPAGIGTAHNQRTAAAHFFMHQPDGIMFIIVRTQRIGTDQFGAAGIFMGRRKLVRLHFVNHDPNAAQSQLPGGFRTSQPGAGNMYNLFLHLFSPP